MTLFLLLRRTPALLVLRHAIFQHLVEPVRTSCAAGGVMPDAKAAWPQGFPVHGLSLLISLYSTMLLQL